jgi:hypothetical protein
MPRRRIIGAILALVVTTLASEAPAAAHPGATVFQISVGVTTPITVLVPADYGQPISEIDIAAPHGFTLAGGEAPPGWLVTRQDDMLVFTGGVLPAFSPGLLYTVRGKATSKGRLIFPVTTRSPDGSHMHYAGPPGSPDAGVVVYAGETPALPGSAKFPTRTVAGGVIVAVGVGGTVLILWRRRRRAPEPSP